MVSFNVVAFEETLNTDAAPLEVVFDLKMTVLSLSLLRRGDEEVSCFFGGLVDIIDLGEKCFIYGDME